MGGNAIIMKVIKYEKPVKDEKEVYLKLEQMGDEVFLCSCDRIGGMQYNLLVISGKGVSFCCNIDKHLGFPINKKGQLLISHNRSE